MRWCTTILAVSSLAVHGFAAASHSRAPGPCVHYQQRPNYPVDGKSSFPEEVTLSGNLIERTFWGPSKLGRTSRIRQVGGRMALGA